VRVVRPVPGKFLVIAVRDERLIPPGVRPNPPGTWLSPPGDREKAGENREGELAENRDIPGDVLAIELEEPERPARDPASADVAATIKAAMQVRGKVLFITNLLSLYTVNRPKFRDEQTARCGGRRLACSFN
jgi:hypothetical protein